MPTGWLLCVLPPSTWVRWSSLPHLFLIVQVVPGYHMWQHLEASGMTCSSLALPWKKLGTVLGVGGNRELDLLPGLWQRTTWENKMLELGEISESTRCHCSLGLSILSCLTRVKWPSQGHPTIQGLNWSQSNGPQSRPFSPQSLGFFPPRTNWTKMW